MLKGYPRKADDISFPSGKRKELRAVIPARQSHPFTTKQSLYDSQRLCQSRDPDGTAIKIKTNLLVFGSNTAGAKPSCSRPSVKRSTVAASCATRTG